MTAVLRPVPAVPDLAVRDVAALAAAVTAGRRPVDLLRPPRRWFTDPGLPGPTPLTVSREGRVVGHLALWSSCHAGYSGQCVRPPRSATGYAYFHNGATDTDTGDLVPVGKLTIGTGHAGPQAGVRAAAAHYDNTGTAAAVVRAGDDEHGIWVAGALVPGLAPERVAELRRSPLSGDWRRVGGTLELVAALAVNSPGFLVPRIGRTAGMAASLVAALGPPPPAASTALAALTTTIRYGLAKRLAGV